MSRVKGHGVGRPLCVVCVCVCACARLAVQATQACALFAVLCAVRSAVCCMSLCACARSGGKRGKLNNARRENRPRPPTNTAPPPYWFCCGQCSASGVAAQKPDFSQSDKTGSRPVGNEAGTLGHHQACHNASWVGKGRARRAQRLAQSAGRAPPCCTIGAVCVWPRAEGG